MLSPLSALLLAVMSPASAATACGPGDLGPAEDFSVFALETLYGSHQIAGRAYAGFSASLSSFSLGSQVSGDVVLAGPTYVSLSNGQVYGDIGYANPYGLSLTNIQFQGGGAAVQFTPGQEDDHSGPSGALTELLAIAQTLDDLPVNGTTSTPWMGGLRHQGSQSDLNVFEIDGAELSGVTSWTVAAPAGSTAVVRIRNFSGGTIQNLGLNTEGIRAGNVLLFFPDAFNLNFANVGINASLLAPQASFNFSNTWIGGTVISRFIFGAGSFGNSAWDGDLSGCTTDFVPPVPVGCAYDWNVVNSWGTGAQVQVDMTWYQQPVDGWEASWDFDHAETVAGAWNGQASQSANTTGNDSTVTVSDAGWNSYLSTNSTVSFGMIVNTPFNTATEYAFTLNGTNCMPLP